MGNNVEDDFTPEEKELLKREARHRIQAQRNREANPLYRMRAKPVPFRAGFVLVIVGVVLLLSILSAHGAFMFARPIENAVIIGSAGTALLGVLMMLYWR